MIFQIDWSGGTIVCDALLTAGLEVVARITKEPVEKGATINDHIEVDPNAAVFELFQSQHPIDVEQEPSLSLEGISLDVRKSLFRPKGFLAATAAIGEVIGAIGDALFGAAQGTPIFVWKMGEEKDRVKELYDHLIKLINAKETCTVLFRGHKLESMTCRRVALNETPEGEFATISVEFEHITIVETKAAFGLPSPADLSLASAIKAGLKAKKPAQSAEDLEKKRSSVFKHLKDKALSDFGGLL